MLRKLAAPALAGVPSACARTFPCISSTDSADALNVSFHAVAIVSAFSTKRSCDAVKTLCTSRRSYLHPSRLLRDDGAAQQAPPASEAASGAATGAAAAAAAASAHESALDVAMRVNKLKKTHQTGGAGMSKKEVEQQAWQALNSLTEDQINNAEGKAVSLLLNSWAYFAKFWAKGKDGPS